MTFVNNSFKVSREQRHLIKVPNTSAGIMIRCYITSIYSTTLRRKDIFSHEHVHNFLNVEHGRQIEVLQIIAGTVPLRWEGRYNQVHYGHIALQEWHVIVFNRIVVQALRFEESARSSDPIALLVHIAAPIAQH